MSEKTNNFIKARPITTILAVIGTLIGLILPGGFLKLKNLNIIELIYNPERTTELFKSITGQSILTGIVIGTISGIIGYLLDTHIKNKKQSKELNSESIYSED